MTSIASSLLDFLLSLFRDPEVAEAYDEDPRGTLDAHGLYDVDPEDVAALRPVVEDCSPVAYGGGQDYSDDRPEVRDYWKKDDDSDDEHRPHEVAAVTHVKHVEENHYRTEIDVDVDARNSIWAGGDAIGIWGDENEVNAGNGIVADEIEVEADGDVALGVGNVVGNELTNVGNEDSNIASGNGSTVDDADVENDIDVRGDGNATAAGTELPLATIDNTSSNSQTTTVEGDIEGPAVIANGDVEDTDQETTDESQSIEFEDEVENTAFNGGEVEDNDVESEIENSLVGQNAVSAEEAENEAELEFTSETEIEDNLVLVLPVDAAAVEG